MRGQPIVHRKSHIAHLYTDTSILSLYTPRARFERALQLLRRSQVIAFCHIYTYCLIDKVLLADSKPALHVAHESTHLHCPLLSFHSSHVDPHALRYFSTKGPSSTTSTMPYFHISLRLTSKGPVRPPRAPTRRCSSKCINALCLWHPRTAVCLEAYPEPSVLTSDCITSLAPLTLP